MKLNRIFLLIILFILINNVHALSCQYTEIKQVSEVETKYFLEGEEIDALPPFVNISGAKSWKEFIGYIIDYQFYVKSNTIYPVDVTVYYNVEGRQLYRDISLDPYGIYRIHGTYNQENIPFDPDSIYYEIHNIEERQITSSEFVKVCEQCLGQDCLNDGVACSSPQQCGGGYCVEGHCSTSSVCFNNDCKCSADEIQCTDNTRCVKKTVVPLDVKPSCNLSEECVSGYIDSGTGLCAKSPAQLQEEEAQRLKKEKEEREDFIKSLLFSIGSIALIFLIVSLIVKHQSNKSKQLDIELIEAEMRKINYELTQKSKELKGLKSKSWKTKKEKERIQKLNDDLIKLNKQRKYELRNLEKVSKERFKKEYEERFHRRIEYDKKGYFVFSDSKTLVHRWVYRHYYKTEVIYKKHIHHIDANHFNCRLYNLIALTKNQHDLISHANIIFGDWKSGIRELKRSGLSEKDFPKKVLDHLKKTKRKSKRR